MVDGLVLASRSAQVILNSLCSGIATWSHFCPITSTCFVLHVFFCAVSWGLSVAVVVVLLVLSGGARATELSVRCLQHMFYTWWLIVQCPCGIFCSVSGACGGHSKFSSGSVLFRRAVLLVGISALWCGTCYFYGFQLLLTRKVRLLVDD